MLSRKRVRRRFADWPSAYQHLIAARDTATLPAADLEALALARLVARPDGGFHRGT